mgnify:CR=1 FL=1
MKKLSDADHMVAIGKQTVTQVRAQEAGTSGNEDGFSIGHGVPDRSRFLEADEAQSPARQIRFNQMPIVPDNSRSGTGELGAGCPIA